MFRPGACHLPMGPGQPTEYPGCWTAIGPRRSAGCVLRCRALRQRCCGPSDKQVRPVPTGKVKWYDAEGFGFRSRRTARTYVRSSARAGSVEGPGRTEGRGSASRPGQVAGRRRSASLLEPLPSLSRTPSRGLRRGAQAQPRRVARHGRGHDHPPRGCCSARTAHGAAIRTQSGFVASPSGALPRGTRRAGQLNSVIESGADHRFPRIAIWAQTRRRSGARPVHPHRTIRRAALP